MLLVAPKKRLFERDKDRNRGAIQYIIIVISMHHLHSCSINQNLADALNGVKGKILLLFFRLTCVNTYIINK